MAEKKETFLRILSAFFPSWKFFTGVAHYFDLEVRKGEAPEELSKWESYLQQVPTGFMNVLFNPRGNLRHSFQSQLQILATEENLDQAQTVECLNSYRITKQIAALLSQPHVFYQFRLFIRYPKSLNQEDQLVLTSPIYDARKASL